MIFKTRKAFEDEICRRVAEIEERQAQSRRLYELEERVRDLTYRVARLEDAVYGPKPGQTPVNTEVLCREP